MKVVFNLILLILMVQNFMLADFSNDYNPNSWLVVDDVVMGGRSNGTFRINKDGHGVFKGNVSLENNGGFSSVRHRFNTLDVSSYKKVVIKLKGDGNRYQFRLKSSLSDYHSYISYFETNKKWQTIEINLNDMYPTFRGRRLRRMNFPGDEIAEIAFLIGNKKAQEFELIIDNIQLVK